MPPTLMVSGITEITSVSELLLVGTGAVGFRFIPGAGGVDPEWSREVVLQLPPLIVPVGIFANQPKHEVQEIASFCRLDVLLFIGEEVPQYFHGFSHRVIKGLDLCSRVEEKAKGYADRVSGFQLSIPSDQLTAPDHLLQLKRLSTRYHVVVAGSLPKHTMDLAEESGAGGVHLDWSALKGCREHLVSPLRI